MKHLYLIPTGGLCNRMRAIAAARRLVSFGNLSLSVVWNWGKWEDLFAPIREIQILRNRNAISKEVPVHQTTLQKNGGSFSNQELVFNSCEIILKSGHLFSLAGQPPATAGGMRQWFPEPSWEIEERVSFEKGKIEQKIVGVHIRRTDNKTSISASPDQLFHQEISRLVSEGIPIYLATDNNKTRESFISSFPNMIRTLRFRNPSARRWPVKVRNIEDAQDDFVELLVLSRCLWVLGSKGSSFSQAAITLNGDPRSRFAEI